MRLYEKSFEFEKFYNKDLIDYFSSCFVDESDEPIKFVITKTDDKYHCELAMMEVMSYSLKETIFDFKKRDFENQNEFNVVMLIPTGINAEIGGHSGDGTPVARLIGTVCDNLIIHPNIVNSADVNEMPENGLYVEGSIITRMLMGTIGLQKVRKNRILVIMDKHEDEFFNNAVINQVNGAKASFGIDCPFVITVPKTEMKSVYSSSGRATGEVGDFENICWALEEYKGEYDAIALTTYLKIPGDIRKNYFIQDDIVNPWGGAEAMLTHAVSYLFDVPSAHAPMIDSRDCLIKDIGQVDPRKSTELLSVTAFFCVLKGLNKSPRIIKDINFFNKPGIISANDISALVIPDGVVGLPVLAALEQGIPVIAVKENKNIMKNNLRGLPFNKDKLFFVNNYLEAAGLLSAMKNGISEESVRRPLNFTKVENCD